MNYIDSEKLKSGVLKERKNFLTKIFSFFKKGENLWIVLKLYEEIFVLKNFFIQCTPDLNFSEALFMEGI